MRMNTNRNGDWLGGVGKASMARRMLLETVIVRKVMWDNLCVASRGQRWGRGGESGKVG